MVITDILLSALSIVITGLASWALALLTQWLSSKLKDKKSQQYVMDILDIITASVKSTYQTYVESLKGTELWTKEAQTEALQRALNSAKASLSVDSLEYIQSTYGDINLYLVNMIEATLYDLKK